MRVVLALDKFKGTLPAQQVCELLAEGIQKRNPKIEPLLRPMADGGEGSAAILAGALGMESMRVSVPDLLGRATDAHVHWQNSRRIALIESSSVLGIERTVAREDVLMQSSSVALGHLLQKAIDLRPSEIWTGLGGTMTADAGWGLASLFGLEALDADDNIISPSLENMRRIVTLRQKSGPDYLHRIRVTALCDVNAPAIGTCPVSLSSFLAQKGAKPESHGHITELIKHFWTLLQAVTPSVMTLEDACTGAAGGLCLGLSAVLPQFHTELGAHRVAQAVALPPSLSEAQLAVCGEGRLDEQTFYGKAPSIVAELAHHAGIPLVGVFGQVQGDEISLGERLGSKALLKLFSSPPSPTAELVRASRTRLVEMGIEIAQLVETLEAKKVHFP